MQLRLWTDMFSNRSVFIHCFFKSIHFELRIQMFSFSRSLSSFPCEQEVKQEVPTATISLLFQMKTYQRELFSKQEITHELHAGARCK